MKYRMLLVLSFGCAAALPVGAKDVACPDLASAVQVATCPAEEELRYTYTGYCSDNARMYSKDETCDSYETYRKLKNIALWESADGEFQAYVSCDLSPAATKAATAQKISVGKAGKLTRLACHYGEGVVFTYRTRAQCTVSGDSMCTSATPCEARCD